MISIFVRYIIQSLILHILIDIVPATMINPIVSTLDGVITRLADLSDHPSINFQQVVIISTSLQTAFEVWLKSVSFLLSRLTR